MQTVYLYRIGAAGIALGMVSASALGDVTPVSSSVECMARTHLTVVELSDEETASDDQGAANNTLGLVNVFASLNTPDGSFETHSDGIASFTSGSSGTFTASCGFSGNQAIKEPAAHRFGNTMSSIFEYDFFTTDTGSVRFTGSLFNEGTSPINYTGRVDFNKETTPGGGIVGGGIQTPIQDHDHDGETFDFTLPLDSPTGNYRITFILSHSGLGSLETPLTTGSFTANFIIEPDACAADYNMDELLNLQDIFAYLADFNAMNPAADLTGEGDFNLQDIFAFLDLYNAGCP